MKTFSSSLNRSLVAFSSASFLRDSYSLLTHAEDLEDDGGPEGAERD
jgi:hypothetical protein